VNHESLASFLPATLIDKVSPEQHVDGRTLIQALQAQLGEDELVERLVQRFLNAAGSGLRKRYSSNVG
jgi:predicted component of type VI protein secretion system